MLVWGVLCPLISFVILVFFGSRLGKPVSGYVACAGMGISMVLALLVFGQWWGMDGAERAAASVAALDHSFEWATLGTIPVTIGVNLDSLTVIMFLMVTFVSFWIFFFSLGYMAGHSDEVDGQSKFHRFFTFLSLFGFAMLGLVISNSLLFMFIFWELVGACSYFLIGFYFDKKFASNAAIKAFVTNRVGDFGFIIGLMLVVFYLQDLSLQGAADAFAAQHASSSGIFEPGINFLGVSIATWLGVCLFFGAVGKSAQVPLQVWLPDAMAGPTPVSALIHAATMVAAGVYLVARIFLLLSPGAQLFIATVGCITLTMAALIAIVQTDIKKILAYSTLSQLGYMIFGLGMGAWVAALFHLITHAFFKALMFLGSGQVIEGCHHEQDIRKMGGLIRKMPVTGTTFLIGVLAIAGFGIPGLGIGLGGYFSKDEILAVAYFRTHDVDTSEHHGDDGHADLDPGHLPTLPARTVDGQGEVRLASFSEDTTHGVADVGAKSEEHASTVGHASPAGIPAQPKLPKWFFWFPIAIAYITPLYMMRCWWLTFMGKPRDQHVYEHAHESRMMWVPLVVLAVGTVVVSYFFVRPMLADAAPAGFLVPTIDGANGPGMHSVHSALIPIVGFAYVVGFGLAIFIYRRGLGMADRLRRVFAPVHLVLERKFFFDEVYNVFLVGGCKVLAKISALFDTYFVDLIVNLVARLIERLGSFSGWVVDARGIDGVANGLADGAWKLAGLLRRPQTGRIRNYVLFAAGGTVVLLFVMLAVR